MSGYELLEGWQKDFEDFCGIPREDAKNCLETLVAIGVIYVDEFNICHSLVEGDN